MTEHHKNQEVQLPKRDNMLFFKLRSPCFKHRMQRNLLKTLKKYDLSEHFRQRKPEYVTEFIHEMLWGKTLQRLVKRGIELAADARERYPDARINLHLSWFGNELVGEDGIAQNPNWPYDGPNGHWPTLQDDCERHLTWFVKEAQKLDLQSAGLTTAPWSADYGIHPIFDQFFDVLEPKFKALTCSPLGLANPNFPWLRAKGYADAMEFRDQWHFANSEENRTRLSAYWTATLFAIDCGWRVGRIGLELAQCGQETWDDLRSNMSAVLDELPRSYQETCASITKLIFGESRRHITPTGRSFTTGKMSKLNNLTQRTTSMSKRCLLELLLSLPRMILQKRPPATASPPHPAEQRSWSKQPKSC